MPFLTSSKAYARLSCLASSGCCFLTTFTAAKISTNSVLTFERAYRLPSIKASGIFPCWPVTSADSACSQFNNKSNSCWRFSRSSPFFTSISDSVNIALCSFKLAIACSTNALNSTLMFSGSCTFSTFSVLNAFENC